MARTLSPSLWPALLLVGLAPRAARADSTLDLSGTLEAGGLDHVRVPFEVPAGTAEIEIVHAAGSEEDVIDWGLEDPAGFRGWGGGNEEPAVVSGAAASRSYLAGPISPGTWHVVLGKALVDGPDAPYSLTVHLRDAATLAPQPERSPYEPVAALATGRRWYAGDLHVHSRESGDARPDFDEIADFARDRGLDFVELSDHNTTSQLDFLVDAQARHPDVLLLPGVEWTSYDGHANGIGATAFVDHKIGQPGVTIEAAAQAFRDQGALFSINHPTFTLGDLCLGCAWEHELDPGAIDAVEIVTSGTETIFGDRAVAFWDALCDAGRHVAPVGGSDDHRAGVDVSFPNTPIGSPTTLVLADALDAASIVAGIRAGRTVVKVNGPDDPMVELDASVGLEGDTVRARRTELVAVVTGGAGQQATWVVDGVPEEPVTIDADPFELRRTVEAPPTGSRRYRVEIARDGARSTVTSHLWVETGPDLDPTNGAPAVRGGGCAAGAEPPASAAWILGVGAAALVALRRRARRCP